MDIPSYKTALIVGAGEGLSASLARRLAKERIKVALAARNPGKLDALVKETGARAYDCDASDPASVARLFEILTGRDQSHEFAKLTGKDRRAILEILLATKPGLPEEWRNYNQQAHIRERYPSRNRSGQSSQRTTNQKGTYENF